MDLKTFVGQQTGRSRRETPGGDVACDCAGTLSGTPALVGVPGRYSTHLDIGTPEQVNNACP